MSRKSAVFVCSECGASHAKWSGRCDACGAWNTISEQTGLSDGPSGKTLGASRGRAVTLTDLQTQEPPIARSLSGIGEFDRVLGGGLVPSSGT